MGIIAKLIANFCALFLAIDIAEHLTAFLSITDGMQPKAVRKMLLNSAYFVFFVAVVIMLLGWLVLSLLNVSPKDMQISGGVLLLIFSLFSLLRKENEVSAAKEATVFPAAAQFIITPVFPVMLLILMSLNGFVITVLSLILNLTAVLYLLINSSKVIGLLESTGVRALSRVFKILLCSYAVMLIRVALESILK